MERPDLDGMRLARWGAPDVWLVYGGRRHRIASPDVYTSLFGDRQEAISFDDDMDHVDPGPELNDGTCLVRADRNGMIFMATGAGDTFRLHHVWNYETLLDFGFDMGKVRDVPQLLVDVLPRGRDLVSAGSRTTVHAFSVQATPSQATPSQATPSPSVLSTASVLS